MNLFKYSSATEEIIKGMEEAQATQAMSDDIAFAEKYAQALYYLQSAYEQLSNANRTNEANAVIDLHNELVKSAQRKPKEEWTPPWKQPIPTPAPMRGGLGRVDIPEELPTPKAKSTEPQAEKAWWRTKTPGAVELEKHEPVEEKKTEREPAKREEVLGRALDLLADMRDKDEYIPTILYLRSVLRKRPNPGIFDKLNVTGPTTATAFLAGLDAKDLRAVVAEHLKEFNVDPSEVDLIAHRLAPDEPTDEEIAKRKKEEQYPSRLREDKRKRNREVEQEFAPSPVRRINPETGEITEIPVEFKENVRRPRFMMQKEPKVELSDEEKEALREERKREKLKKAPLPTWTPEEREAYWAEKIGPQKTMEEVEEAKRQEELAKQWQSAEMARLQEEEEARVERERAKMFGGGEPDWLAESALKAETNFKQAMNILVASKKKKKNKDKTSKNPGKTKDEKKVWKMYGYTDGENK